MEELTSKIIKSIGWITFGLILFVFGMNGSVSLLLIILMIYFSFVNNNSE